MHDSKDTIKLGSLFFGKMIAKLGRTLRASSQNKGLSNIQTVDNSRAVAYSHYADSNSVNFLKTFFSALTAPLAYPFAIN